MSAFAMLWPRWFKASLTRTCGHLVKKRVALLGQGKRGGARTIVATRGGQWFLLIANWRPPRQLVRLWR